MEAAGFTPEDYETDPVELLPENEVVFDLFCSLGTQWRVGMSGATGLDYGALYPLLDRQYPDLNEWRQAFADIRAMEIEALTRMKAQSQ